MTHIYFVRHAEPEFEWKEDRTRPLTSEGIEDSKKLLEVFRNISLDFAISSPYTRSMDTIYDVAKTHQLEIKADERLRERGKGNDGNNSEMFQKRWDDFDFHEEGGESLHMVQKRNIEALLELLTTHTNQNIILGTHGTALSCILNYYNPAFNCIDFLRIIDYMPYIIRLDFDGTNYIGKEEILIIKKVFKGKKSADKNN